MLEVLYLISLLLEIIFVSVFIVLLFYKKNERGSIIVRLISAVSMAVINCCQLPMEIELNKSYAITIFLILIWIINTFLSVSSLKGNK